MSTVIRMLTHRGAALHLRNVRAHLPGAHHARIASGLLVRVRWGMLLLGHDWNLHLLLLCLATHGGSHLVAGAPQQRTEGFVREAATDLAIAVKKRRAVLVTVSHVEWHVGLGNGPIIERVTRNSSYGG